MTTRMTTRARHAPIAFATIALFGLAFGLADPAPTVADQPVPPPIRARPDSAPEASWISLSGSVAEANARTITLFYGEGRIPVALEDREWPLNDLPIERGDRITVYGRIDEDLFEGRGIVAESIYVPEQSTYYHPDGDFRGGPAGIYWFPAQPQAGSRVSVSGMVTSVEGDELVLDAGDQRIRVDTRKRKTDRPDDSTERHIEAGDHIWVSGVLDLDFLERREIRADQIVTLTQDERPGTPAETSD